MMPIIPSISGSATPARTPSQGAKPAIRYLGFKCTDAGREYTLQVGAGEQSRVFTLVIPHAAFANTEARFQDAPDLCFAKVQRDLAADTLPESGATCVLSAADLAEYRDAQARRQPQRKSRVPSAQP